MNSLKPWLFSQTIIIWSPVQPERSFSVIGSWPYLQYQECLPSCGTGLLDHINVYMCMFTNTYIHVQICIIHTHTYILTYICIIKKKLSKIVFVHVNTYIHT